MEPLSPITSLDGVRPATGRRGGDQHVTDTRRAALTPPNDARRTTRPELVTAIGGVAVGGSRVAPPAATSGEHKPRAETHSSPPSVARQSSPLLRPRTTHVLPAFLLKEHAATRQRLTHGISAGVVRTRAPCRKLAAPHASHFYPDGHDSTGRSASAGQGRLRHRCAWRGARHGVAGDHPARCGARPVRDSGSGGRTVRHDAALARRVVRHHDSAHACQQPLRQAAGA